MYYINIKEFRRTNNMTQSALAEYLGITQAFVSNMEAGRDTVPEKYIRKFIDDPDIDSSMIKGGVDDENQGEHVTTTVFFEKQISLLTETIFQQQNTILAQHKTIDRLLEFAKITLPTTQIVDTEEARKIR